MWLSVSILHSFISWLYFNFHHFYFYCMGMLCVYIYWYLHLCKIHVTSLWCNGLCIFDVARNSIDVYISVFNIFFHIRLFIWSIYYVVNIPWCTLSFVVKVANYWLVFIVIVLVMCEIMSYWIPTLIISRNQLPPNLFYVHFQCVCS